MSRIELGLVLAVAMAAAPVALGQSSNTNQLRFTDATDMTTHPYLGMWVTKDGHIRQELLPTGRYDEGHLSPGAGRRRRIWLA